MVPNEWKLSSIGEHVKFQGGSQPPRDTFVFSPCEGYIRLIQIRDYKTDKYATYIPAELAKRTCEEDDIMIGRYGPPIFQILRGLKGAYNVALIKAVPDKYLDKQYLYHFLCQEPLFKLIDHLSQRSSGQTGVDMEALRNYKLPLPPLAEQKKIAEILRSVEESIASTQAVIDQTHKVKQGLLQQLLTKGIGHTKFKESAIGKIPEAWQITTLNNIVEKNGLQIGPFGSQLHASDYTDEGLPVVMPKDIVDGKIVADKIARIPETIGVKLKRHQLKTGDIVFGRRGDIGRCGLVSEFEENWYCGTGCIRARLKKEVNPLYLIHYLRLATTIQWLNDNAVGQTMLNLNTTIIGNLPVVLPTQEEQNKIAENFEGFEQQFFNLNCELSVLFTLKRGLMQDLLTGKFRVKQTSLT